MPNRLANETSPYLLQHAANPVDWYPWGVEALSRARAEDRPILLSIGYAACHWCHVMAHESFEDEATARVMNAYFVNVKVDREERPDIDAIYMQAVQAMTGHGGWPMTMFLTPEGVPFYAGTYFPPAPRHGMPSFRRILEVIADAYAHRRGDVEQTAVQLRAMLAGSAQPTKSTGVLSPALLERAYHGLAAEYDDVHHGFGAAPKFPQAMALDFLLRHWVRTGAPRALEMARDAYVAMARGGIRDQLAGGFARYAVDAAWQVPHFEKMLYDNALLARLGVHLWQATGEAEIRGVAETTLDWALGEMRDDAGGFTSSLDADSEGVEGRFYVWSREEVAAATGDDAAAAIAHWGVTDAGNFDDKNILNVARPLESVAASLGISVAAAGAAVERARAALLAARARRVRPARDDKVLTAWNALTVRALADAARAFDAPRYREAAVAAGRFLVGTMVRDGKVLRSYNRGAAQIAGYLEDHAALGLAALALHELTLEREWLDRARALAATMVDRFWDDATGAFFDTARDHETLIVRPRDATDNATPSGTSLAAELLVRIGEITHDADALRRATYVLETVAEPMARFPTAFGHMLGVADLAVHGAVAVALVGERGSADLDALARTTARRYLPGLVLVAGAPGDAADVALLADRPLVGGRATAYVCRDYRCDAPATDAATLDAQLTAATAAAAPAA